MCSGRVSGMRNDANRNVSSIGAKHWGALFIPGFGGLIDQRGKVSARTGLFIDKDQSLQRLTPDT